MQDMLVFFSRPLLQALVLPLFLMYPALADLKRRSYPVVPVLMSFLLLMGMELAVILSGSENGAAAPAPVLVSVLLAEILPAAAGAIPGLIFLGISKVTGDAVAPGDGLVILLAGLLGGLTHTVFLCLAALMMTAGVGMFLIIFLKKSRKTRIPFLPFLLAAELFLLAAGM